MKKVCYCAILMVLTLILVSCVYSTYRLDGDEIKKTLTQSGTSGTNISSEISAPGEECCPVGDIIACIMIKGELYYDTGLISTVQYRCGVMDGTVDSDIGSNRLPQKDNQSNFGKDFGYQYGGREGTIEVLLDDGWRIFAVENVRDELLKEQVDFSFNDDTMEISDNTVCEIGKGVLKCAVELSDEDANTLCDILTNGKWDESGISDCNSNVSLNLSGHLYYYHSECGTFNSYDLSKLPIYSHTVLPEDLGKSLVLSESDKQKVNGILEKYISLTQA